MVNKNGQSTIEMPFQMIFSLILIAMFLFAAFTGIKYFTERTEQAQIAQFVVGLESKVKTIWQATDAQQKFVFDLPKSIELVCFGDLSKKLLTNECPDFEIFRRQASLRGANMFFCPPTEATKLGTDAYFTIDCDGYDCLGTEQLTDPYCFVNDNGKITMTMKKELGSATVQFVSE